MSNFYDVRQKPLTVAPFDHEAHAKAVREQHERANARAAECLKRARGIVADAFPSLGDTAAAPIIAAVFADLSR